MKQEIDATLPMSATTSASLIVPEVNNDYRLHVIHCGEIKQLERCHGQVRELISPELLARYSEFPGGGPDFPAFFYLEQAGRICSYFRTIPDEITIGNDTHRWAWSGDNFTYPEYRNRGLSTQLHGRATAYLHEIDIGRAGVHSTDEALRVFKRLGFNLMGYASRYLLLRSLSPVLDAHISNRPVRHLLKAIGGPVAGTAASSLKLWNRTLASGTNCMRAKQIPIDVLEQLLPRISSSRGIHFNSDAAHLQRKFALAQETGEMSLFLIYDTSSDECLGYMVVRERTQTEPLAERYHGFRLMTLMDFGYVTGNSRAAAGIVRHLIEHFFRSDCDVVQIISSDDLVNRSAARRGMRRVGKGMSFTYSMPGTWNWLPELSHLESWPLTSFCGDAFTW